MTLTHNLTVLTCATFALFVLIGGTYGFNTVLESRAYRHRVRTGAATFEDCVRAVKHHLRQPRRHRLVLDGAAFVRIHANPRLPIVWLGEGHDWALLLLCYEAGFSDIELHRHLSGAAPIDNSTAATLIGLAHGDRTSTSPP